MQKNISRTLILAFLIGTPAYARDFEECWVSSGQNEGFMYNDGRQDRCCLTDGTTCSETGNFSCAGFFNMPSSVWSGWAELVWNMDGDGCYVNVPKGKYISDTYDLFDDSKTYDDLLIDCNPGYYCPGMSITYSEVKGEYWGSTSAGAFPCPDAPNAFINSNLTEYATVENGHILSTSGAYAITSCYLASGTYYDNTGTYRILDTGTNCSYAQ